MSGGGRSHFTELKTDPGAPGLESLLVEVNKLERVRRLELPADLFADVSERLVDACRTRASKEYPANLERMKPPRRLTLLADAVHPPPGDGRLRQLARHSDLHGAGPAR